MNAASSRSHSIFALYLKGTNADRNEVSVRDNPNPNPSPNPNPDPDPNPNPNLTPT